MDFYDRIKDEVSEIQKKFNYPNDGTAFGHFIIKECFSKIKDINPNSVDFDNYIKDHIVDMANDLGNDAIFVNEHTKEIMIFQFKYSKNQLLNTDEIKKNKKFIDWILGINGDKLIANNKLNNVIFQEINPLLEICKNTNQKYNITFYYIDNNFEKNIKNDIKALFTNYKDKNIDFDIRMYNYEELEQIYDDVEIPQNNVELKIVENEYFIKKLNYFDDITTECFTIVTSIFANSLKKIVEEEKELLFSLNVRYYKGENEINSKIKEEYGKGKENNFWILNNGINAICEDFEILENKQLKIKNFQIVNGGQTTKTLTKIVNDLPDEVQILMRLTKITSKNKISKISINIAQASNSQNAISNRDLHSGDKIQTEIFRYLDKKGIFYDKKDGEWNTIKDKKKYRNPNGKSPLHIKINNVDLGISYLSLFLQIPISSKGRNKLVFSNYYEDIFNIEVPTKYQFFKLMFAYEIRNHIYELIDELETKYEILQNNYIGDVVVSLSPIYFVNNKNKLTKIEDLEKEINGLDTERLLDDNYQLNINKQEFENFVKQIIKILQNILDIKKEAKLENNSEWISSDTVNWLKKDNTYEEIYTKTIQKLKQDF